MAKFYIADLHIGHENVIRFDNRPFKTVDEMNAEITRRWNQVVGRGDTVYVLGDFIWKKSRGWGDIVPKLNGQIILIRGNHDPKRFPPEIRKMLSGVYDYHELKDNGRKVILCHYPILFYNKCYRDNVYMLCGHVHATGENDLLEKYTADIKSQHGCCGASHGQIINVGCMMPWMDYTPKTLDQILQSRYGE